MVSDKLRRQIAHEAARLMYVRQESEFYRAKIKAARRVCGKTVKPHDLPTHREIREEIQLIGRLHDGDRQTEDLREKRIEALRLMRMLKAFRPRLVGDTLTGHSRNSAEIAIMVFSETMETVLGALKGSGILFDIEHETPVADGVLEPHGRVFLHDRYPTSLAWYPVQLFQKRLKSSENGGPLERASIDQLKRLLSREYPEMSIEEVLYEAEHELDRFQLFEMLLMPLEHVKQDRERHPEGDVLYHSLQVFCLARDEMPYDEEFLVAALLHDVGKALDPKDHVVAALEALDGYITSRTAWLIQHHAEAVAMRQGTLGARSRRRLESSENFEDLLLLSDCDRNGRQRGVRVPEVDEALAYLRDLATACGE